MLAVFPTLLPEEPLYSAVARYADMMGFGSESALYRSVFGFRYVNPSADLPGRIDEFVARLLPGYGWTAERILEEHTALPYWGAFLPRETVAVVRRMLRETHGGTAYARMGLNRATFRPPGHLRYCESCVDGDRRAPHGVAYWRRVHQLPGVVICPDHDVPLRESDVDRRGRWGSRMFVSLERSLSRSAGRSSSVPGDRRDVARAISRSSLWLLQHGAAVESAGLDTTHALRGRTRLWCAARGWAADTGTRLRSQALATAVLAALGVDILNVLGCEPSDVTVPVEGIGASGGVKPRRKATGAPSSPAGGDWVTGFFRRPKYGRQPLLHLLLFHALDVPVDQFFGPPPESLAPRTLALDGPCGNPACSQYDPPVPRPVPLERRGRATHIAVTCAGCGYRYTHGVGQTNPRNRVILETGPLWDARLCELVAGFPATAAVFERELGMDVRWVQRHAIRLGVWHSAWTDRARQCAVELHRAAVERERARDTTRERYRQRWLALRAAHPDEGRVELHARDRTLYFHLHEHDKAWLVEHLPQLRPSRKRRRFIDWPARDAALLSEARSVVATIRSPTRRPVQVTVKTISRGMGRADSLRRLLPNLPETRAFIASVVEDWPAFARRRVVWAAARFAAEGVVPTASALAVRAAIILGPKAPYSALIRPAVDIVAAHLERGASLPRDWELELSEAPWTIVGDRDT